MTDATLQLGQDMPESALDLRRCAEVGLLLADRRARRSLTVEEVANQLLLSKRQVQALEQPEPRVFHAPAYFLRALRKYCAYLDVTPDLCEGITYAVRDDGDSDARRAPGRRGTLLAVMLALALAGVAGAWFTRGAGASWWDGSLSPAETALPDVKAPPDAPTPEAATPLTVRDPFAVESLAIVPVEDQAETPVPPPAAASQRAGGIDVTRDTWVFIRYPDNSTVERSVAAGERVAFTALPVYVAVGTAEGVVLTLGERPVDVSPFISNGQVRITRDDIRALTGQ